MESSPVSDRHKLWIDEVSELFGGLDICALEIVVGKDGREHIIELNDSALTLMGDTQDEDRRLIADLVVQRMQVIIICNSFYIRINWIKMCFFGCSSLFFSRLIIAR